MHARWTVRHRAAAAALLLLTALVWMAGAQGAGLDGLELLREGRSMRSSSADPNWQDGNWDARPIPPGETLVIADLAGPGVIQHIWNTVAAEDRGYSRLLLVRMYWDGEEEPSVVCPLGDFFGVGHGLDRSFISEPIRVSSEGRARNCYWPMPFRKSARITVTNEGERPVHAFYYYVDWVQRDVPNDAAYFHAMYRQEHPAVMGRNYLLADIAGRGHYVGTLLNVRQRSISWWGEGDDFFYIDGEEEPSIRGTGSEDYLCDAWGLRWLEGPYYGVPVYEQYEMLSRTTAYRWHIPDPVLFTTSLRVEIEHKGAVIDEETGEMTSGFTEREDDFSSVAFWYQTEPHKPFPPIPHGYDRLYYPPTAVVEGEALVDRAVATAGAVQRQELGGWSGGAQLFWTPEEAEQELRLPLEVPEDGAYAITLLLTKSWDYGVFEISLDDEPIGKRIDLSNDAVAAHEVMLPPVTLTAGEHTLLVRNVGSNAEDGGCFFGLDGWLLLPHE